MLAEWSLTLYERLVVLSFSIAFGSANKDTEQWGTRKIIKISKMLSEHLNKIKEFSGIFAGLVFCLSECLCLTHHSSGPANKPIWVRCLKKENNKKTVTDYMAPTI